ncbi:MAG TPA: hypothetical protein VKY54_02975 [Kiloniellales bacterium]|mgnify:CR=1 FL=1|jgi:hypothetical protein|nr:hypothetical protein [Kiloniellales bacterium]
MARVGIFLALLLLVALIGAGAALLFVEVTPPTQTIEKAVPDDRLGS